MLGKRSRAMHSAASFSHMDLHLDAVSIDATPSQRPQLSDRFSKPQPAPIPQVVGFNLAPKCSHSPGQFNPCLGSDQQPPFADLQTSVVSSRPPVSPRSALQTLLAATRQVVIMDNSSSMVSPVLEAGEGNQGTAIPKPSQQSSTLASKLQTKTETKGIDSAVVSSHHRKFWQHSNETSQGNHAMPGYPYSKAHIGRREITSVEGKGKLADSPHFLFLATSPLVDASTVVTPKNNFLDSCYLCRRPLGHGLDIFIYRGDKAFCSIDCRDEQILMDEWKERGSSSMLRSGSAVAA